MYTIANLSSLMDGSWMPDINTVVPVLILITLAATMWNDEKYAELRSLLAPLLRSPRQILLEVGGFALVVLVVLAVLLLHPDGWLASSADLSERRATQNYLVGLRQFWPVLLNPDSLLAVQQLMRTLGVTLLVARGATAYSCRSCSSLALAMMLLASGSALRIAQWVELDDYVPEGPLGGKIAATFASAAFVSLLVAAWTASQSAKTAGASVVRGGMCFGAMLAVCAWSATANHLTASNSAMSNFVFTAVDVIDMCAALLLTVTILSMALKVPNLGGAVAALAVAQVLGAWWFSDFYGLFEDPNSQNAFELLVLEVKTQVKGLTHGRPFELMAASHIVQSFAAAAMCTGYAVLRGVAPQSTPMPKQGCPPLLFVGQPVNV